MAFDAFEIDRRRFVTWSVGGAFVFGISATDAAFAQNPPRPPPADHEWYRVAKDGRVTVISTSTDMGQGAQTGHAALLAEELDVPWEMVSVELLDMAKVAPGVLISTGGSRSIREAYKQVRMAGAIGRAKFAAAAAATWKVDVKEVATSQGKVTNMKTGEVLGYGQLAAVAALTPAPQQVALKTTPDRICGVVHPGLNQKGRTDGSAKFGIDVRVPGMVFASVKAAPRFGAKLASVDEAPALAVPGVKKVVKLDDTVGVIATSTWAAFKGVQALKPVWTEPPIAHSTSDTLAALASFKDLKIVQPAEDAPALQQKIRAEYAAAPKKVEAVYEELHVIHAAMEPMNCTVHVTPDKVELWVPTQSPTRALDMAAKLLNRNPKSIKFNGMLMGGGFGRRGQPDYVRQAVLIAKEYPAPVQMVWTREEDFAHGLYRPQMRQTYRGALGSDGMLTSYEVDSIATDTETQRGSEAKPYLVKSVVNAGVLKTGVPFGSWRSVTYGQTTFGREGFINECAHAAGIDPVEYRMKLLGDNERVKRLVRAVADGIDYDKKRAKGFGVGIACGEYFQAVVANAVEVEVKDGHIRVLRSVVAADMGRTVTPGPAEAQYQGGVLMALSAALGEAMTYTNGAADQSNYSDYKIMRLRQAPPVKVLFFESPDMAVGGAGEPPLPGVAPALSEAVFMATGKRVRSLPFSAQGFKV